jgi:hypothetical protein
MSRPTIIRPDKTLYWVLRVYDADGSLLAAGPDSTPTVTFRKNGGAQAGSPTVTLRSTSIYDCSVAIAGLAADDVLTVAESVTIATVEYQNSWEVVVLPDHDARLAELDAANIPADVDNIKSRLPAALVGGTRMDSSVGAMASAVLTSSAIATDAITATKIQTDAIGASELATDAVNEIRDSILNRVLAGNHSATDSVGLLMQQTHSRQIVYAEASIWIDTTGGGTNGSVNFVNGTSRNPSDNIEDANTLKASLKLETFKLMPQSSVTFNASQIGELWNAYNATVILGGQNVNNTAINGALVIGAHTGTLTVVGGTVSSLTSNGAHRLEGVAIADTVSIGLAASYYWDRCWSAVPGSSLPVLDFGAAVGATTMSVRHYSGGLEVANMQAGDVMDFEADGHLLLAASCTGGNVSIRGNVNLTDNSGGAVTINQDARFELSRILSDSTAFDGADIADIKSRQVVYEEGAIWIDLLNGSAGSVSYVNGISRNPVDNITDANTLSAALGLTRFKVAPSNISNIMVFSAAQDYQYFDAQGAWINLNGQSVNGTGFKGCLVLGVSTGSGNFENVTLSASTFAGGIFWRCAWAGTVTMSGATSYYFDQCFGAAADPTLDFGAAVANTTAYLQDYSGEINVANLGASGTDVLNLSGSGHLILAASCTGGTVNIRGNWNLTNNGSEITINQDARFELSRILADETAFNGADVSTILTDTGTLIPAVIGIPAGSDIAADIAAVKSDTAGITTIDTALSAVDANVDNIQTRLPPALVGNRMDSDIGNIQNDVITAAAIATDALGALEVADTLSQEIADLVSAGVSEDIVSEVIAGILSVSADIKSAKDGIITIVQSDDWSQQIVNLGDMTTRDNVIFAVKKSIHDPDEDSVLMIDEVTGLLLLNGSDAVTPASGSIVVDTAITGDITPSLNSGSTSLIETGRYTWSLKVIESGNDRTPVRRGSLVVEPGTIDVISA